MVLLCTVVNCSVLDETGLCAGFCLCVSVCVCPRRTGQCHRIIRNNIVYLPGFAATLGKGDYCQMNQGVQCVLEQITPLLPRVIERLRCETLLY
jgi:hypothetical protein